MSVVTLAFVENLAREAGDIIRNASGKIENIKEKSSISDVVTEWDVKVEEFVIKSIREKFPNDHIISEETSNEEGNELPQDKNTWLIDPIDGTANFVHTHPHHCCSIGYAEAGKMKIGVVYVPYYDEMYSAERGKGAHLNGKKISVAPKRRAAEALVATGFCLKYHKLNENGAASLSEEEQTELELLRDVNFRNVEALLTNCNDLRRHGSCAVDLCMIASGRIDAYVEMGPHSWDYAGGSVILEEAGGVCGDYNAGPINFFCQHIAAASSPELLRELCKMIQKSPVDLRKFN